MLFTLWKFYLLRVYENVINVLETALRIEMVRYALEM